MYYQVISLKSLMYIKSTIIIMKSIPVQVQQSFHRVIASFSSAFCHMLVQFIAHGFLDETLQLHLKLRKIFWGRIQGIVCKFFPIPQLAGSPFNCEKNAAFSVGGTLSGSTFLLHDVISIIFMYPKLLNCLSAYHHHTNAQTI